MKYLIVLVALGGVGFYFWNQTNIDPGENELGTLQVAKKVVSLESEPDLGEANQERVNQPEMPPSKRTKVDDKQFIKEREEDSFQNFQAMDFDKNIKNYEEILEKDPNHKHALRHLSGLYLSNREPEKALEVAKRCLKNEPGQSGCVHNLIQAHLSLGQGEQAKQANRDCFANKKSKPTDCMFQQLNIMRYDRATETEINQYSMEIYDQLKDSEDPLDQIHIKRLERQLGI